MTPKIKMIVALFILNIAVFKWIIPIYCIIKLLLEVGSQTFYIAFFNCLLYIVISLIIGGLNLPALLLSRKDKQCMEDEVKRINNKNK
jgi:hypothetical protein